MPLYQTVFSRVALVVVGRSPIDSFMVEKKEIYENTKRINSNENDTLQWTITISEKTGNAQNNELGRRQEYWDRDASGRLTYKLIPIVRACTKRKHGNAVHFLIQAMTNHGNFNKHLHRFKFKNSSRSCDVLEKDAKHVIFESKKWTEERQACLL